MVNKMSAKEMFEKLGYKQKIKDDIIYYFKEVNIPRKYGHTIFYHINFELDTKRVFHNDYATLEELQAIKKQIEELGWIDNE